MLPVCFAVFFIHAILTGFDEFGFHLKRNLSSSEKWARPLDTLGLIGCFSFALWAPFNLPALWFYLSLAISSIIFSLRDEFIQSKRTVSREKTVHTLLFLNQPILFVVNAVFWCVLQSDKVPSVIASLKKHESLISEFLLFQCLFAVIFFLYQLITWNRKVEDSKVEDPETSEVKEPSQEGK